MDDQQKEERKRRFREFLEIWEDESMVDEAPIIDYDPIDYVNPIGKGKKNDE
jgi:hypothetical protein